MKCKNCPSFAINPDSHGRQPEVHVDLCDVCYWREIAAEYDLVIMDLSMILRRIITKSTQKKLDGAWDYLCRKGLQGSILRTAQADRSR